MNQICQSIQIALLYSIKTDDAQEFQLDKIEFLNKTTKQFYDSIKDDELLQVKGLFGPHKEVEREIKFEINQEVSLQSYLNHSDKGNLIAIKFQKFMIFCFILSETFFVNKPINEKAIEIVLFRILQDLTDNIKLCFNDNIVRKNWYQGDIIPFKQIQKRAEYYFAESENKQMLTYDCRWYLSQQKNSNYQIINSQTLSPQFARIRKLQLSQEEIQNFNQNYENFQIQLLIQILNIKDKQTNQLMKLFRFEHQSKDLKVMLDKLSGDFENECNDTINILINKLVNNWKSFYTSQKTIDDKKQYFEQQVDYVLKTVRITNQKKFTYDSSKIEQNNQNFHQEINTFFDRLLEKIQKAAKKYNTEKDKVIAELQKQTTYEVERISLKLTRDENEIGKVQNISQIIDNQQSTILNGDFLKLGSSKFTVDDIFETKEKAHIFIITSQNDKGQPLKTHIYFQSYKTIQIQPIKQLDIKDTEKAIYFHDYNRGHLYIFNVKHKYVVQIIITSRGSIQNEQSVYYQQERDCSFVVSHVAYLKMLNRFIVLSIDKLVYKQQDQGQDFEKVKCRIQSQNGGLEQKDFIPSIRPEYKYNQLLACPSGKYFYLANQYCCDRYDVNCLKLNTIEIEGPIKIFADYSDVIILGQLNQREQKKAKIICNLVSQKKFNKQQNDEKKVIGNPALDIAKGSFIKFGPNSQFLLKEKNNIITLNINNEYYNIVKAYLNVMKVNEIILSSSQLQSAEFKSQQIKNCIFSRVPLQLCTIENSNLIPLNDGFRQESQTQTRISVDQKVKQLHLGFLEEHLSNCDNKIFVVGIIGKQSSGKSYLLNRVFGTRFAVSSARCTDGVWASIAYVEDQTFLVLDCEGLFNGARSDKEEIKMLAFLTALCDITILNSDLTFNRHFNDLFNHLVEASKQLNNEKLFKGILYFILRDVSSQDNAGAEQELLERLERLKEGGSQDIIFLKRLFNNKIAVESLDNYKLKQFDEQIVSVRKYILEKSAISSHWNCGRELIQIMKILLCQLELSDKTNASLIDLQILIEKIFEDSQELWYDFSSNEVQDSNLKLVQSNYKFPKFEAQQHILFNKDLLKLLYENLITEDTISTHNKNMLQVRTQFNMMMEQRKEQIIQRAKQETNRINNEEVKEIIEKNMSILKIFLTDQIRQYQFCDDKCDECHLQCKQFKNHIEIFQILMQKLDNEINSLLAQQQNSIKNKSQEQEKRDKIKEIIKEAEYTLEGLTIQRTIIEIKEKLQKEIEAMKKYDFYDSDLNSINKRVFKMTQFQNENSQTVTLEDIENLQNLFENEIPILKKKKEKNTEIIKQQMDKFDSLNQDLKTYQKDINQIEVQTENLLSYNKEISEQKLIAEKNLQSIQSEISKNLIVCDKMNLQNLQQNFEDEKKKLIEIQDELQYQQLMYKQYSHELEELQKLDVNEQIQFLEQLEQDINQYLEKQNLLDEEIESLKKKKREQEDIRSKLGKEQSKKMGKRNNIIEELVQQLKGFDELLINEKLSQCEIKQKELEKNFRNFENSEIYNKCLEEIGIQQENQIDDSQLEKQDLEIQTDEVEEDIQQCQTQDKQDQQNEIQCEQQEKLEKLKIINLFFKKKQEKVTEIQDQLNSLQEQIEFITTKRDNINQRIQEKIKINKLLDIQQNYQNEICKFEKLLGQQNQKLSLETEKIKKGKENQEEARNTLDQVIKNNIELENLNIQIDEQIKNLNQRLDQIISFSENLNEYIILNSSLQEEEIKLKKLNEYESVKSLSRSEVQSQIEKTENQIYTLKEEKDSLSSQLSTFNQFESLERNLRSQQHLKQQLIELKIEVHSCQRENHKCDKNCKICSDKKCDHKAGHDEKQEHMCNKQDHRCQDICQIINCKSNCMKSFNHDFQHKCENDHPCMEKCQYCDKKCKKDRSDSHNTNHDCLDNYCPHNCKLCSRRCCEPHKHSLEKANHFCENVHYCKEPCQEDGRCKLEYEVVQTIWKNQLSEFQYIKYIPQDNGKQICQKQIPARCDKHDGKHLCKEKTEKQFHLCNQQCPECNTYCDLKYNHQGPHSSDRHRNKENQIFTTQQKNLDNIKIQDQKETTIRQYRIGESSEPETCDSSCQRRGRAHFHLIKCEGGQKCLQKKDQIKARHSDQKYVGFEHLDFDEVLCENFWKLQNWIHPNQNE
ncbi:unnamed protein product [Paramecium octaurelia]|uniref:VLIG-type G domain-containing protein n=1 Tax=Paramecium octaurelia TaxID=43137 RepID=A0A8S1VYW5_PAROT|nr:unnamed protein product [Paramecium octaurelia]